jgi:aldose 1-epimerase
MAESAPYTAERVTRDGIDVVRLYDAGSKTEVLIAPSYGNNSYQMTVNGKPVFWEPAPSIAALKAKPNFGGNPFLAPWANRLSEDAFWANGVKFKLQPELNNFKHDGNGKPIHGLLAYATEWEVVGLKAGADSAEVTSRLDFGKYPKYLAQFPFNHVLEMTYRLRGSELQVVTSIENRAVEPMPLSIGFHPYFQITDAPRDEWTVHVAAREHVMLSDVLVPTGKREPVTLADPVSMRTAQLDDVFTGLVRGSDGLAEFWVKGKSQQISVVYGPTYQVAVVYAPPGRNFICFEPMTGLTNAMNLNQQGLYPELQSVPAGKTWTESFWIRATGY